jgi:hypothetical protein
MSEQVSEKKNQIVAFVPSESSIKRKDVFVGNLSLYTTGEKLRNFFVGWLKKTKKERNVLLQCRYIFHVNKFGCGKGY